MARWWSERLDAEKHRDYMGNSHIGGLPIVPAKDRLIEQRVYFVEVVGFTFQFASIRQIELALNYFNEKIHMSSMQPDVALEHYWQRWFERLPLWLSEEPKREKVVVALTNALATFSRE